MTKTITAQDVLKAINSGKEIALIDVRERGACARGRLLLSVNIPLSHFEFRIKGYVPRHNTQVILHDTDERLARRAARLMEQFGYTDAYVLEGGISSCAVDGFELFQHHYVFTYAFGLYVSKHYGTPEITAPELKAKMDAGEDLILLDTRQPPEFRAASIPGSLNVPTTELIYRIKDLVSDRTTPVFVNCGAITRGVLGGQTLLEAGIENPIQVLSNGVRGWFLAGYSLDSEASTEFSNATPTALGWSDQAKMAVKNTTPVSVIEFEQLQLWQDDPSRTLFIVDVRTESEYTAGHLPNSRWILGSEIVGLYEDYIATRNARICLVDDNEARATVAATWLVRMGWPDVHVLKDGVCSHRLETGPAPNTIVEPKVSVEKISTNKLADWVAESKVLVLDFADSATYEAGHIPGAWWTIRSSLPYNITKLPSTAQIVTTSPDGVLATLAAADLDSLVTIPVSTLNGGTNVWINEGRATTKGLTRTIGEIDDLLPDVTIRESDDYTTAIACAQRMVQWQEELLQKIELDRSFSFPPLP